MTITSQFNPLKSEQSEATVSGFPALGGRHAERSTSARRARRYVAGSGLQRPASPFTVCGGRSAQGSGGDHVPGVAALAPNLKLAEALADYLAYAPAEKFSTPVGRQAEELFYALVEQLETP